VIKSQLLLSRTGNVLMVKLYTYYCWEEMDPAAVQYVCQNSLGALPPLCATKKQSAMVKLLL
jgi:hypothetical protein